MKELAKFFDRFAEGIPGFAWLAIVLGALLPVVVPEPENAAPGKAEKLLPVIAVGLAYLAYTLGHYLDNWLFGPFWGVRGWLAESFHLGELRRTAAEHLLRPVSGIYAKCAALLAHTEVWEHQIKLPLEISKAARSLIVVCILVLGLRPGEVPGWVRAAMLSHWKSDVAAVIVVPLVWWRLKEIRMLLVVCLLPVLLRPASYHLPTWLESPLRSDWLRPRWVLSTLALCLILYVGLRIRHMKILYRRAAELTIETRGGFRCAGLKALPLRTVWLCASAAERIDVVQLQKAETLIQSLALMHVDLKAVCSANVLPQLSENRWDLPWEVVQEALKKEPESKLGPGQYEYLPSTPQLPQDTAKADIVLHLITDSGCTPTSRKLRNLGELDHLVNGPM